MLQNKSNLALIALIAAGYAGNYFNLSLFFGVDFLFGSIAVLLVLYLFGIGWGTIAAFLASLHTIILWNHPYATIILTAEALFVGILLQRNAKNILLLDAMYWLLVGMPSVWIFYAGLLQLETTQCLLVVLKQTVNGIFNALIANLIVTHLPIHKWVGRPHLKKTTSFEQTLLNLFVAFVFFPAIIAIIFDGNRIVNNLETTIQNNLQFIATDVKGDLEFWHQQRLQALKELAKIAADSSTSREQLQQSAELLDQIMPVFDDLYVVDVDGNIITASPKINSKGESRLGLNIAKESLFKQTYKTLQPSLNNQYIFPGDFVSQIGISVPVIVRNEFDGLVYARFNLSEISRFLKSELYNQQVRTTLLDSTGRIIASSQPEQLAMQSFYRHINGEIKPKEGGIYQWLPPRGKLPAMMRWKKSFYIKEIPIGGNIPWTLIVEVPAEPHVKYLQNVYTVNLALTLLIAAIAMIAARFLSRWLVRPMANLATETTNLPNKIIEQIPIQWIDSSVTEISSLVENFQQTSTVLKQKFQEITSANENLEDRVKERTQKLVRANQKLRDEVNERKQIEAALKKERNFISAILDTTGALVIVLDSQGRIIRFNRACEETTQYAFAEVQNQYVWDLLLVPEELDSVKAIFQQLQTGKLPNQYENYWVAKDGNRRLIAWSNNVLLNPDGSTQYVIGSGIDITQRQQAEEALRKSEILREQAEALEQANRIKDEFLAIVSHELRTPLNSILGWSKLLRSRKYDEATTNRALETIERNAKSQAQLIEDILDISRIIRGKIRLNMRPVNLVVAIEAAINSVLPSATTKSIQLESQLESVGLVSADAERLQQVVWNLLSNAIKFTPEGGRVEVRLCPVMGDGNDSLSITKSAQITIKDSGKGISPEFLPYVFERFRQADSSITRSHGGLGLGLAIARHLIELHGGTIFAHSDGEDQGATFTIILPLLAANKEPQNQGANHNSPHPTPNSIRLDGLQILVVDDDTDTRDFLVQVLEEHGAKVTSATSVQDALAKLSVGIVTSEPLKPDVLVSDIGMPNSDGYSLIHQIRSSSSHLVARIPAVALTAYTREEDKKQAIDAGFQIHLSKPVEPTELVTVVAKLAGRGIERVKGKG